MVVTFAFVWIQLTWITPVVVNKTILRLEGVRIFMVKIPEEYKPLFQSTALGNFATLTSDEYPHVTPVWVDIDEEEEKILINTGEGRQKDRNIIQNPKIGLSIVDPKNAYRYISVVGEVVERRTDGAVEHIQKLSQRYRGEEFHNLKEDEQRIILVIKPEKIMHK
jgi:PPOX class probable F420-dependent enzyme